MNMTTFVLRKAKEAREGARVLLKSSSEQKNTALVKMAEALQKRARELVSENKKDIDFARKKGFKIYERV